MAEHFRKGYVSGTQYRNPMFDFSYDRPIHWGYASDSELATQSNMSASDYDESYLKKYMTEEGASICDMQCDNGGVGFEKKYVAVSIENDGSSKAAFLEEFSEKAGYSKATFCGYDAFVTLDTMEMNDGNKVYIR